ncbi:MAG: NAD(P)H-dependent oxidoreductase subunit E [Chloroflexi bacterium]|jgi:NADH-quinone oxidoreductase subunit E|nr:NAD(P)H-dependent oxidoreductase subunit E [Chloroflexota bacterium]
MAALDEVLDHHTSEEGALIAVLQEAQGIYGYLPSEVLRHISRRLRVPLSQIYGVATFYAQFYLEKRGRNTVRVCDGTACHVRGAAKIITALEKDLGVQAGETTPDYRVSLEVVYCLGSCGLSPVAVINDHVIGRLIPEKAVAMVRELQ